MLPALDRAAGDIAVRQRHGLVGALVAQRVHGAAGAGQADRALADVSGHRAVFAEPGQAARRTHPPTASSSALIAGR